MLGVAVVDVVVANVVVDEELDDRRELLEDSEIVVDGNVEVTLVEDVVLVYIFNRKGPPQYSSAFPLQTILHSEAVVGTLPAFKVFPQ